MNFYKHYIGDFQRDTGHLSLTERGAYLALIHHYYATETPLPKALDALCRIAGAVTKSEREAVKAVTCFFESMDSGLVHSRIEAELHKAGEISNTNRSIALAREENRRREKEAKESVRTEHESYSNRAQSVQRNVARTPPRIEHPPDSRHQTPEKPGGGGRASAPDAPPQFSPEFRGVIASRPELNAQLVFDNFVDHYPAEKRTLPKWKKWVAEERAAPQIASTQDPNSRASVEAVGVAKGLGAWDELTEPWAAYKARVRATVVA